MSVQQFTFLAEGFTGAPTAVRAHVVASNLSLTADGGTNKDGSSYQVYDWPPAEKLGFVPKITFATKAVENSTMLNVKFTVPCASYKSEADIGGEVIKVDEWTVSLTVRGGSSNLTPQGLADLKSMIDSVSSILLLNPSTGVYGGTSPVLNSLLRGNALVK